MKLQGMLPFVAVVEQALPALRPVEYDNEWVDAGVGKENAGQTTTVQQLLGSAPYVAFVVCSRSTPVA